MRELRIVNGDKVIGTVDVQAGRAIFTGKAGETFTVLRRMKGELPAARELLKNGWSNGYVYLSDNK